MLKVHSHFVRDLHGLRRLLLWPIAFLLKLWGRTLSFEVDLRKLNEVKEERRPYLLLIWHNQLFPVAEAYRRFLGPRKMAGLVSASRDGAWLAAFFQLFDIYPVRGSSSRRGGVALHALRDALIRDGYAVAITPDGPRGPCYSIKEGIVWLAEQTQSPILLLHFGMPNAWQLKTWDRFAIPRPFSKIHVQGQFFSSVKELQSLYPASTIQDSIYNFYRSYDPSICRLNRLDH